MMGRTGEYPPRVANEVRGLSWNLGMATEADHIILALRAADADFLFLCELNAAHHLRERIRDLGYHEFFVDADYRHNLRKTPGGIAFYSRFPVEHKVIVPTLSNQKLSTSRQYLEMRLRISESFHLTVGGTHHTLPWQPGYRKSSRALWQEVSKHAERYLCMGDLNSLPLSRLIRRLRKQLVHLGPSMLQNSYPRRWKSLQLLPPRRLDYAFATADIAGLLIEEAWFGSSWPSDHNMLLIRLRIRG